MNNKLILTSYGLTTGIGRKLIGKELRDCDLAEKRIFLFHEPYFSIEAMLVGACLKLGFKKENIILSGQQKSNQDVLLHLLKHDKKTCHSERFPNIYV